MTTKKTEPKPTFEFLKKAELLETVPYKLLEVPIKGTHPILHLKRADRSNKELVRACNQEHPKLIRKMGELGNVAVIDRDEAVEKEAIKVFRDLFPRFIVTDWENVWDDSGKKVNWSAEAGKAFFSQLPDYSILDLVKFATNRNNYHDLSTNDLLASAKN